MACIRQARRGRRRRSRWWCARWSLFLGGLRAAPSTARARQERAKRQWFCRGGPERVASTGAKGTTRSATSVRQGPIELIVGMGSEDSLVRAIRPGGMSWFDKTKATTDASEKRTLGEGVFRKCESCAETRTAEEFTNNLEVCPSCGFHYRMSGEA